MLQMLLAGINYGMLAAGAIFTTAVGIVLLAPIILLLIRIIGTIIGHGGKKHG